MHCVKNTYTIEDTIKKSRFISILIPCQTENEAIHQLNLFHQQHPNASHIVFAYRILSPVGISMKYHDGGEPNGTAGKPVYQHLQGKNLINILCVVIRYFGGIKLGAGGLTRAYGNCAKKVILGSKITPYIEYAIIQLKLEYNQIQRFEYQLDKLDGLILQQDFSEHINLVIKIPKNNLTLLSVQFNLNNGK